MLKPMSIVQAPLSDSDPSLPVVWISVDRHALAKRIWRTRAEDGREIAFHVDQPLYHGASVLQAEGKRYVLRQEPESVLEVDLPADAQAAARLGWTIGNLHLACQIETSRLRIPESPEARRCLQKFGLSYRAITTIFHPDSSSTEAHSHGG